jgi:8-oxo-dGTP pyrophosphatase MutT (NUDIX family)
MDTIKVPESLKHLAVPGSALVASLPPGYDGIASSAIAFHPTASPDKILLVQRAAHDSNPHKWEVPGGAVDDEDPTFLHAAARELKEEAGLIVKSWVGGQIGSGTGDDELSRTGYTFKNRRGMKIIKYSVEAVVEDAEVKLDPNEHQDWVWATREDVEKGDCSGRRLIFTSETQKRVILEAFRLRAERKAAVALHNDTGKSILVS